MCTDCWCMTLHIRNRMGRRRVRGWGEREEGERQCKHTDMHPTHTCIIHTHTEYTHTHMHTCNSGHINLVSDTRTWHLKDSSYVITEENNSLWIITNFYPFIAFLLSPFCCMFKAWIHVMYDSRQKLTLSTCKLVWSTCLHVSCYHTFKTCTHTCMCYHIRVLIPKPNNLNLCICTLHTQTHRHTHTHTQTHRHRHTHTHTHAVICITWPHSVLHTCISLISLTNT